MRITQYLFSLLITVCCGFALSGCAGEDGPDPDGGYGAEVPVTVAIAATDVRQNGTAAYRDPMDVTANELIHNWQIVFVDNSGITRAILNGTPNPGGVRSDRVNGTIAKGTYTVYAFANITAQQLQTYASFTPTVGQNQGETLRTLRFDGFMPEDNVMQLVPMTGKREVTVTGRTDEVFQIEVIRLFAKVEFTFRNASQNTTLTVNGVQFGPQVKSSLPAFFDPRPNAGAANKPDVASPSVVTSPWLRNIGDNVMQPGASHKTGAHTFCYVPESTPDCFEAKRYYLLVDVTRNGEQDIIPAFTNVGVLPWIGRNDYIQIPIALTDWVVDYDVLFYPPIGGYPAVQKFTEGKQVYFTFGSQGAFAIVPRIKEAGPDNPYLQPEQYTVSVKVNSATAGMFVKQPAYDAATKEIVGELSGTAGTAEVEVTASITSDATSLVYTRLIYILVANP